MQYTLDRCEYMIKWPYELNYYGTYRIRKTIVYYFIHDNDELGSSYYTKCF